MKENLKRKRRRRKKSFGRPAGARKPENETQNLTTFASILIGVIHPPPHQNKIILE